MLQKLISLMSTKGSNAVGRDHGQTLPVRGKLDGASCVSDSFSVTFSPISFCKDVLGCPVRVKPTETCSFGVLLVKPRSDV